MKQAAHTRPTGRSRGLLGGPITYDLGDKELQSEQQFYATCGVCKKCEEGNLTRLRKREICGANSKPGSTVRVVFPYPDYLSATSYDIDNDTKLLCSLIERSTGINLVYKFKWIPIVRCCVPKVKPTHIKNCSGFFEESKTEKLILFGKKAVSMLLFGNASTPDINILSGRKVEQDGKEYLVFAGTEIFETFREWPERLSEVLSPGGLYCKQASRAKEVLQQWAGG